MCACLRSFSFRKNGCKNAVKFWVPMLFMIVLQAAVPILYEINNTKNLYQKISILELGLIKNIFVTLEMYLLILKKADVKTISLF